MLARIRDKLNRTIPPEVIATRPGPGGQALSYIRWSFLWNVLEESDLVWEWIPDPPVPIQTGNFTVGFSVRGLLTIEGITRGGIGYAPLKTSREGKVDLVDCGVKDAETDARKRACALFGRLLGFQLIESEDLSELVRECLNTTNEETNTKALTTPKQITTHVPASIPAANPQPTQYSWTTEPMILDIAQRNEPNKIHAAYAWILRNLNQWPHPNLLQTRAQSIGLDLDAFLQELQTSDHHNLAHMKQLTYIGACLTVKEETWRQQAFTDKHLNPILNATLNSTEKELTQDNPHDNQHNNQTPQQHTENKSQ
jgi:hypothetical protein